MLRFIIFFGGLTLVVSLLVFVCDFGFKHLLWQWFSRSTALRIRWAASVLIWGGIIFSIWYGYRYKRFEIDVNHVEISSSRLPASFDGYRIAQISDLHLDTMDSLRGDAFLREVADSIFAQKPDIIVFTGDLVSNYSAEARPFAKALRYFSNRGVPVYSILGNHDYGDYANSELATDAWKRADRQRLIDMQEQAGWKLLNNESVLLRSPRNTQMGAAQDTSGIALVGVENIGEPPFSVYGDLARAMGGFHAAKDCFTILLSHNPTHWRNEVLPKTDIDLTLSGHTHAMQLRLMGWSPSVLRYKEWGGLYTEGSQHLYVNTGLGCVGFPFRIGVAPEVSVITLKHES